MTAKQSPEQSPECFCTENMIVQGCSIHDHAEYDVPESFAARMARLSMELMQARQFQENKEPKESE